MSGRNKIYTFSIMVLTAFAVSFFALPAADEPGSNASASFTRCEACHTASADTTKSSQHYRMKCTDCHSVSGFTQNTHSSTIPLCSDCHAGASAGKQHTKYRYFSKPVFVYSPNITEDNKAVYVSLVKPVNGSS